MDNDNKPEQVAEAKVKRKFEIQIFDEDLQDNGNVKLKPVRMDQPVIIEAATKEEFAEIVQQFKDCGQTIKILREIDPQPRQQIQTQPLQQTKVVDVEVVETKPKVEVTPSKTKPRIFKVGDIELKDDNGTMYQKQWLRLTDTEAANFRVVNNTNNKIVNLSGKHLEMKRWVKVEGETNDETSKLEGDMTDE